MANPTYGTGRDGDFLGGDPNGTRTAVTGGGAAAGQSTIPVASAAGFATGQEVLVIQVQGAGAGNYEIVTLSSVGSSSLQIQGALARSYAAGGAQVLKVPHFGTVSGTINTGEWNGSHGGVVVFRAMTVSGATVDVSAKGFKGGYGNDGAVHGGYVDGVAAVCANVGDGLAQQGSSPVGTGSCINSANGGGGGGSVNFGSGGGGGHATAGGGGSGSGGSPGSGGSTYGSADLSQIFMGSGGGGGTWGSNPYGGGRRSGTERSNDNAGQGGGIAIIYAGQTNGLSVTSNGANGGSGGNGYGGGGGAGGSIKIIRGGGTAPNLTANGGAGGSGGIAPGASGGAGRTL